MKRMLALFAALLLICAALFPLLTVQTNGQEEASPTEQTTADKLQGEDTPAAESAALDIGKPLGKFTLTAYCPCVKCCNKEDGITATGTTATAGRTIAVDPAVIPYGSTVTLYYEDGTVHSYIAEDCGGAIKKNRIDVFFSDHQTAREFGIQTAYVYMEENNG